MPSAKKPERLHSLDILRGFDMFWITGGSALVAALASATDWNWMKAIENQMHHAHADLGGCNHLTGYPGHHPDRPLSSLSQQDLPENLK